MTLEQLPGGEQIQLWVLPRWSGVWAARRAGGWQWWLASWDPVVLVPQERRNWLGGAVRAVKHLNKCCLTPRGPCPWVVSEVVSPDPPSLAVQGGGQGGEPVPVFLPVARAAGE